MNFVRAGLLVVTSIASTAMIVACSGGGGGPSSGAGPCCAATGVTEAPPAAFTEPLGSRASAGRLAQPIAFAEGGATSCITATATGIQLPEYEEFGRATPVSADGRYLVDINEDGAGRRVLVRIFDRNEDGDETDRGIAALAVRPAIDPEGPAIPVSPIRFGAPNKLGESSLELAVFCEMESSTQGSGNDLQNLSFNDVRALVTSAFASAYSGADDVSNAITQAGRYRHAINGLVNLDTANRPVLEQIREEADALVDACRSPNPPAGLECATDGRAEFYRYWYLARRVDDSDFGLPGPLVRALREHLQALAQDMSDAITDPLAGGPFPNARVFELFRENHRLRLEIAAAAIESAATCFGAGATDPDGDGVCEGGSVSMDVAVDTGTGSRTIREALESVRIAILTATDELAIEAAWTAASEDIVQNFGVQSGLQPGPDTGAALDVALVSAYDGHQPAAQFAIVTTASHLEIAGQLYDPGPALTGAWENIDADVANGFSGVPPQDRRRITDIIFYATANATDITL